MEQLDPRPVDVRQRSVSGRHFKRHWPRWILSMLGARPVERCVVTVAALAVPLATWFMLHK